MYYTLENKRISVNMHPSDNDLNLTDEEYNAIMERDKGLCDYEIINGNLVGRINQESYKEHLRYRREFECFVIVNRGQFWYDTLTEAQKAELKVWYQAWLDVTETKVIPNEPSWLK